MWERSDREYSFQIRLVLMEKLGGQATRSIEFDCGWTDDARRHGSINETGKSGTGRVA